MEQSGARRWSQLFCESHVDQAQSDNRVGPGKVLHKKCFTVYRGLAVVESVGTVFGTAIFVYDGQYERMFFFKNKVFVEGKKVTSKTCLTDVLKCDTVVVFEAKPYRSEHYDIKFSGTRVDVVNHSVFFNQLFPALNGCSSTFVDSPSLEPSCVNGPSALPLRYRASAQSLRNCSALVKQISENGGMLDYTPEVSFDKSVVCISEYVAGLMTLQNIIPVGTKVSFHAVIESSGIKATRLWIADKPKTVFSKESADATNSCLFIKGYCGTVESYSSANKGSVGGFKIEGKKTVAIFRREEVYFPEPSDITLIEYLPVGTCVYFDGKLVTSEADTYVKVSFLWCGKRPSVVTTVPDRQPLSRDRLDSESSMDKSVSSICTSVSDSDALTISRNGIVNRYISEHSGIIECTIFGKESEVPFHRNDVSYFTEMDCNVHLGNYLPVGSLVCFTAEMFTSGDIVIKTLKQDWKKDVSSLLNVVTKDSFGASSVHTFSVPTSFSPKLLNEDLKVVESTFSHNSKKILTGRCGIVKHYKSQTEGVLQCTINNVKQDFLFTEDSMLVKSQMHAEKLTKAFPVGTAVNFDAKVIKVNDSTHYIATAVWVKKKPKPETSSPEVAVSNKSSSMVSDTTNETFLHNRASKVKCFVSDVEGIVEFSFQGSVREAVFHKDVVYIPEDVTVPLQNYITVGRNVFFDGQFVEGNSGRVIITSLWAEKKNKVLFPSKVVSEQVERTQPETGKKLHLSCVSGTSGQTSTLDCVESYTVFSSSEVFIDKDIKTSDSSKTVYKIRDSSFLQNTKEILFGRCGIVKYYNSQSEGMIESTINNVKQHVLFTKNAMLIKPQMGAKTLSTAFPVGTAINFDAKVRITAGCIHYIATAVWTKKKPKPGTSFPLTTSKSKIMSDTPSDAIFRNCVSKVKCFVSDVEGIVEFSYEGSIREAVFHKDVVYIPEDITVPLQNYITVGRNVYFDGQLDEGNPDRVIITSLWAEKKKKVLPPSKVVKNQVENTQERPAYVSGTSSQETDCEEYSIVVSSEEGFLKKDATTASSSVSDKVICIAEHTSTCFSAEVCIGNGTAATSRDCEMPSSISLSVSDQVIDSSEHSNVSLSVEECVDKETPTVPTDYELPSPASLSVSDQVIDIAEHTSMYSSAKECIDKDTAQVSGDCEGPNLASSSMSDQVIDSAEHSVCFSAEVCIDKNIATAFGDCEISKPASSSLSDQATDLTKHTSMCFSVERCVDNNSSTRDTKMLSSASSFVSDKISDCNEDSCVSNNTVGCIDKDAATASGDCELAKVTSSSVSGHISECTERSCVCFDTGRRKDKYSVQSPGNHEMQSLASLSVSDEVSHCAKCFSMCSCNEVNRGMGSETACESFSQDAKEIIFGQCGIVNYYNSQSEGVIECTINDVKQDVLFTEDSVLSKPQMGGKKLTKAFPVGTAIYFDAKVIMLDGYFQYIATAVWTKKKHNLGASFPDAAVSSITSNSNKEPNKTTEAFQSHASKVKCFTSDLEGVIEFSFEGSKREAVFHKDVVYLPKDVTVSLQEYLTVGRDVFFDGQFKEGNTGRIIITSLWAEKKTKVKPPNRVEKEQIENMQLKAGEKLKVCKGSETSFNVSGSVECSSVCSSFEGFTGNEAVTASQDCEMSTSVRGLTATILSYISKHAGIIQCTISKKKVTATFHKSVVYIPEKAKNLTLEEYLPIGGTVHLDGEVTVNGYSMAKQPALTVTHLWEGKKPKPLLSESSVQLIDSSFKLSQNYVYEAEVVSVDKFCFTANIMEGYSKFPVIVWNQFFRPSATCEETLKMGELVSLHVCIGDTVFLRVVKNTGKTKEQFEWCACDAWKDSGMNREKSLSVHIGNDQSDRVGTLIWLDEMSAFLRDGDGMEVAFQRKNALLFGIPLTAIGLELTKIFRLGDSLSYILANEVEAAKVWYGAHSIGDIAGVFTNVKNFCKERSVSSDTTRALVNQLCRESSKAITGCQTSHELETSHELDKDVSADNTYDHRLTEEEDNGEYIYKSSSASTDDESDSGDSESDSITSDEDGLRPVIDLHMYKNCQKGPVVMELHPSEDEPSSPPVTDLPLTENGKDHLIMDFHVNKDISAVDVNPTKDEQCTSAKDSHQADELTISVKMDLIEDKQSPVIMDLHPVDDKLTSSLASNFHLDVAKTLEPVTIDLHYAEDKLMHSDVEESASPLTEDKLQNTLPLDSHTDENKAASNLVKDLHSDTDKTTSNLVNNLHLAVEEPACSVKNYVHNDVDKHVGPPQLDLHLHAEKPANPLTNDFCSAVYNLASSPSMDLHIMDDRPVSAPPLDVKYDQNEAANIFTGDLLVAEVNVTNPVAMDLHAAGNVQTSCSVMDLHSAGNGPTNTAVMTSCMAGIKGTRDYSQSPDHCSSSTDSGSLPGCAQAGESKNCIAMGDCAFDKSFFPLLQASLEAVMKSRGLHLPLPHELASEVMVLVRHGMGSREDVLNHELSSGNEPPLQVIGSGSHLEVGHSEQGREVTCVENSTQTISTGHVISLRYLP